MTPSEAEKEFEEWEEKCTCLLGWNSEGKRCVIHFDKNCPFHYPDSELAKLKEAHSRQQEKIEGLRDRADLVEAEAKVEELEGSFNRLTLDLIEAKRNHALELAERLKVEEKMKELEYQLRDDTGRIITMLRGRVEQAEARVKELERNVDIAKDEVKELRSLHDAGIKEAYRICGVEDDGEYRWKWVLLELSSRINRIKELEKDKSDLSGISVAAIRKRIEAESSLKETESEREHFSKELIAERMRVVELRDAIDKHEKFKRTHEKVVALEDEELYSTRKEE